MAMPGWSKERIARAFGSAEDAGEAAGPELADIGAPRSGEQQFIINHVSGATAAATLTAGGK